jgi:hypothetical protein
MTSSEQPPASRSRAFVDESYRSGERGEGLYVFSAVTVAATREDELRERLRRALPRRMKRFHWGKDSDGVRLRCMDVIRTAELVGVTVLQLRVRPGDEEGTRQHMLWSLAFEMLDRDVSDLVFEARDPALNRRDQRTLASITRTPAVAGLRYTFARPLDEPLLWLPDYLAGIHRTARLDGVGHWLDQLPAPMIEVIEVPPRNP